MATVASHITSLISFFGGSPIALICVVVIGISSQMTLLNWCEIWNLVSILLFVFTAYTTHQDAHTVNESYGLFGLNSINGVALFIVSFLYRSGVIPNNSEPIPIRHGLLTMSIVSFVILAFSMYRWWRVNVPKETLRHMSTRWNIRLETVENITRVCGGVFPEWDIEVEHQECLREYKKEHPTFDRREFKTMWRERLRRLCALLQDPSEVWDAV